MIALLGLAFLVTAAVRLAVAAVAAAAGDTGPATAYGFGVVFPLLLAAAMLALGPARTREGVLMRLGVSAHLVLVAAVPVYALHLALGLPVVFLLVEVFETRLPARWREPVSAWLVRC